MGYLINRLGGLLSETPVDPAPEGPTGDYSTTMSVGVPPARGANPVSLDRVAGMPAAYRAISVLGGVASQMTLQSWRGPVVVTPTPSVLAKPDPWRDLGSWIERAVVSLATDGNLFTREHRMPDDSLASVEVLDPYLTHVRWVKGVKSYTTYDHRLGRFVDLGTHEVRHTWGLQLPGHTRGLGPIEACRVSLGGALDVRDYASTWFAGGDVPSGVLSSDQSLDAASVAMYRKVWADPAAFDDSPDAATLNRRLGPSVRVLGKGLTYSAIALKPADAQWIESQNWGVLEMARLWGLPANYLHAAVEGSSLTYANLEMVDTQFLRLTLIPGYLRKIESLLSAYLPHGQAARFDLSEWLRPDAKTEADVFKVYIDAGVLSPADVHAMKRFPGTAPGKPAAAPAAPAEPTREDAPA